MISHKLVSREFQKTDSVYHMARGGSGQGISIGGQRVNLSAELPLNQLDFSGPEKVLEKALEKNWATAAVSLHQLKNAGLSMLAYRAPQNYLYDPEGLRNTRQLQFICQLKQKVAMPLLAQVSSLPLLEELAGSADLLQIPAQQMRNTELLAAVAHCGQPLILQRAADAGLTEFLLAAEFLLSQGQKELILAESFMPNPSRPESQMLDFANIQLLQQLSHLPVFVSLLPPPSWGHSASQSRRPNSQLSSLALAAVAAGAQGIEFGLNPQPIFADLQHTPHQLLAEWDEALYLTEQLGQLATLLQREIVRLPISQQPPSPELSGAQRAKVSSRALKVAFQGEPGAYSEQALRQFFASPQEPFDSLESVPCVDFRAMFEVTQKGEVAFATVPLENSLAGSIMENHDLLLEYPDLCICGETRLRVSHMLLAPKGSQLEKIQIVRSHPQALAQSSRFLERHGLQAVANFDTAGSARELQQHPEVQVAAIASALAAEIFDLEILARAIENNPHNYTRFAIVTRRDSELLRLQIQNCESRGQPFGNKWSFCLRLRNFSGSLATALEIFQKYQLNLTRLESRPIMGQPWSYRFYLDTLIDSGMNNKQTETGFFRELESISEEYRVIGRYWENLT